MPDGGSSGLAGKHSFTTAERWAVFTTHGARCYLCGQPIDFTSMEVDHIIPERLLDEPEEFAAIRNAFALPEDFNINSYENWLPSCGRCNGQKSGAVFDPMPIVAVQLVRASKKALAAREVARRTISDKRFGDALALVEMAVTMSDLPAQKLKPIVQLYLEAHPDAVRAMLEERDERENQISRLGLGFQTMPEPFLELRLTPFATVLYRSSGAEIVATPYGVGFRPTDLSPDPSFYCGHCGSLGPWSGARCLSCGYLSDND
jgi:5-methylcytosine-specific restriction endonuclease McrA